MNAPSVSGYSPINTGSFNIGGTNMVLEHVEMANYKVTAVLFNISAATITGTMSVDVIYGRG